MIRFLANRYTREEVRILREAIYMGIDHLTSYVDCKEVSCIQCCYYRPCLDLSNFLKRLDEILTIPEGVQK